MSRCTTAQISGQQEYRGEYVQPPSQVWQPANKAATGTGLWISGGPRVGYGWRHVGHGQTVRYTAGVGGSGPTHVPPREKQIGSSVPLFAHVVAADLVALIGLTGR